MSSYYKEVHDKLLKYLEAQGDRNIPDLDTYQFRFQCPSDCWGTCCGIKPGAGGIGVALTPWDLYRLAQGLGKSMQQTLYDHCALVPDGVHYPAVMLAPPLQALPCEFLVEDHKCGIRAFAPEVCRGAPVTSSVAVSEEGVLAPHYWLRYPHADCAGQDPGAPVWTARDWIEANGVQYEMDHDHQFLRNLLVLRYNYDRWKTPEVDGALVDLLFTPDRYMLRPICRVKTSSCGQLTLRWSSLNCFPRRLAGSGSLSGPGARQRRFSSTVPISLPSALSASCRSSHRRSGALMWGAMTRVPADRGRSTRSAVADERKTRGIPPERSRRN